MTRGFPFSRPSDTPPRLASPRIDSSSCYLNILTLSFTPSAPRVVLPVKLTSKLRNGNKPCLSLKLYETSSCVNACLNNSKGAMSCLAGWTVMSRARLVSGSASPRVGECTALARQLTSASPPLRAPPPPPPPPERAFRAAELAVFSNASNYRRDPLCPLVVPLVNPHHLAIIPHQQAQQSPPLKRGFIATNANCSTTGIAIPLHALEKAFGPLEIVMVTTMQAISGAGYPGVSSLDILDNVVPYIGGEEEKIEWELSKILGGINSDATAYDYHDTPDQPRMKLSAQCNRVPVLDGHLECLSVKFVTRPPPSPNQVVNALRNFTCEAQELQCPSAPQQAIYVHDELDRPQPRLDRYFQNGAGVNVGRVRECAVLDLKMVVLSNNVSIGAATSSIINVSFSLSLSARYHRGSPVGKTRNKLCGAECPCCLFSVHQAEYAVAKNIV